MTRLDERDMSPGEIPEGRILPGDARHSEFFGITITPTLLKELMENLGTDTKLTRTLACCLHAAWKHDINYYKLWQEAGALLAQCQAETERYKTAFHAAHDCADDCLGGCCYL